MRDAWKNRIWIAALALFLGAGLLTGVLRTPDAVSVAERRKLAQLPALTWAGVWDGTYFPALEAYLLDQFPLRDRLRTVKAGVRFGVLRQRDNNGVYLVGGGVYKLEYPTDLGSVRNAADRMERLYAAYLDGTDCRAYLAVIPDKNYYVAAQHGYPSLDYGAMRDALAVGTPHLKEIELFDCLSADAYYRTDTHWRQEALGPVVERLAGEMGLAALPLDAYTETAVSPFYGVYYGQSALPLAPETLTVLEQAVLERCEVLHYETGRTAGVYDWEKLSGMDAYDVFLSGASPLLVIDNPSAATDRELVVFRDSFASSLAPLLTPAYRRVTLVDTRYMASDLVGDYVAFDDQDVLFLYSTLLLNNSVTMK